MSPIFEAPPLRANGEADRARPGVRRVHAVVNPSAGSVTASAMEDMAAILAERSVEAKIVAPADGAVVDAVRAAIDDAPDAVIVLGGDGTARCALEYAGPDGPPLILLPGGTMNVLPHALYGDVAWPQALALALDEGEVRPLPGARANDQLFFVAGIFGSPARMAPVREALRRGRVLKAATGLRSAMRQAFQRRLRVRIDASPMERAEAVAVLCPLFSRANEPDMLETAFLDPKGAASALRLSLRALSGAWRADPAVHVHANRTTEIYTPTLTPAILDGETTGFGPPVRVEAVPQAARVLAPPFLSAGQQKGPA